VYTDVEDEAPIPAELARMAEELAAFLPHVIVNAVDEPLIPAVEQAWPASARFRPRYLPAHLEALPLRTWVQQHPEARKRIFGVETAPTTPAVAKLVLRNNQVFPTKVDAFSVKGAPYDGFYVLAYAAAALGGERITGPALARALPRLLPPGEPIDVGAAGIYQALTLLGAGKGFDLVGSVTTLDFDPDTGDAPADFAVFCLAPGQGGALPEVVESGLVYRARTRKLEGAARCP
jgi:branched-chain amino acid transport system substrate-binding protein